MIQPLKCLNVYRGHRDSIQAIVISPDGNWFISASKDATLKRWETSTGRCLNTYQGHQDSVEALAIAPDGYWFVSSSGDRIIKLWDLKTGKCRDYTGHQGSVEALAIAPDGSWFVSGSDDGTLKRWDVKTEQCLGTYDGHRPDNSPSVKLPVKTVANNFCCTDRFGTKADGIALR
jgi:WD40 repeat protein